MPKRTNNEGITLIALIITIIVLLILAGITVGALTTNNSVLKQSKNAKKDTLSSTEAEKVKIAVADAVSQATVIGNGYLTTEYVSKGIKGEFGEDAEVEGEGPWTYFGEYGIYDIDDDGIIVIEDNMNGIKKMAVLRNEILYILYNTGELYKAGIDEEIISELHFNFKHIKDNEILVSNNVKDFTDNYYWANNDLYKYDGTKVASNVRKFDITYYLTYDNELYLFNNNIKIDDNVTDYFDKFHVKNGTEVYCYENGTNHKVIDISGEIKYINSEVFLTKDGTLYGFDVSENRYFKVAEGVKELNGNRYLTKNGQMRNLYDNSVKATNVKRMYGRFYLTYSKELYNYNGEKKFENVKEYDGGDESILSTDNTLYKIGRGNSLEEMGRNVSKKGIQCYESSEGEIYWWMCAE